MEIKIGTRNSRLALIQTGIVVERIKSYFPDCEITIVPIVTTGDKITDRNLYDIGGKALFLKELEEQLWAKNIDMAVHSLKDVPGVLPDGMSIAAVLEREDARDCFVSLKHSSLQDLPTGAVIGTSSVRRKVLINNLRPDIEIVQFRGNLNTRLEKLRSGVVDGCILAVSGLMRAKIYDERYCHAISENVMLPATGQGIIAVEICDGNNQMRKICQRINNADTWLVTNAERAFVEYLDASCRTPLAAYATLSDGMIFGRYMLSSLEGDKIEYFSDHIEATLGRELGLRAAKILSQKIG
jgi:hydroxymethylbilane synthase